MIVSWNWLAQHVRLDMPVEVLAERLALSGLNHEGTSEVGGDLAIDLEITSNRPDCLSHIGVAREVAAIFGRGLCVPDPRPREAGPPIERSAAVVVESPELCPRFTARLVTGATVRESPWWMRKRLETLGVRPISNIVDITNYVMFECGQPLHAYDLAHLAGRRLIVRAARAGEKLTAINNKVYELDPTQLVIADAERPVGLAGVMGGLDTEIGPATRDVLIEAAQFDMMSIRRTSAGALGLTSPSSHRFERPMDPERTEWASRRLPRALVLELAGGTLHEGVIDIGPPRPACDPITLRLDQLPRVLGIDVDRDEVERILQALGLEPVASGAGFLTYRPPSWRSDLTREIDLIEEVARIHGYEHIPEGRPVPLARSSRGPRERVESAIRVALTGLGLDEACTFSLVADDLIDPLGPLPASGPLRVDHASRRKDNALRVSLIPSLLAARAHNEAHGSPDAALFEIANVYLPRDGQALPDEPTRLGLVTGLDYFGIKGLVESLLAALHVEGPLRAAPATIPLFAAGRAAELRLGDVSLGHIGEIAADRRARWGLRSACAGAELDLQALLDRADLVPQVRPLPDFPAVARGLSLVVPIELPWEALAEVVRATAGPELEGLEFLDTFRGGDLPPGQHSLHFGLSFRHPARTLAGEEADRAVAAVIAACAKRFGASLRG